VQHQPIESSIGDKQVAAATKHKQGSPLFRRPRGSFGNLVLAHSLDKPASGPTDPEGRERRKRLIF
jgi:hypothetical protein